MTVLRWLPVLSALLTTACTVGNPESSDPTIAAVSIIGSVIVSCFVAWLILR